MSEEASKAAKARADKAEDEVAELVAKARQLETELDMTAEKASIVRKKKRLSLQLKPR